MTKEFANKVFRERILDVDGYRYIVKEQHDTKEQWFEVRRLPLDELDTTAALNGWETVYDSRKD